MKVFEIVLGLLGMAMFAAIAIFVLPYLLSFSAVVLGVVIACALLSAVWKAISSHSK